MVRGTEMLVEWLSDAKIGADRITLDNGDKAEA
jgi:hypothetical protein